jgi:hypothetical protein
MIMYFFLLHQNKELSSSPNAGKTSRIDGVPLDSNRADFTNSLTLPPLLVTRRNAMMFDEFLKALIRTNYEIGGR